MNPPKGVRRTGPVGVVLPLLVLAIGVIAIVLGVPKAMRVASLQTAGKVALGRIDAISHANKKTTLGLAYVVDGVKHSVDDLLPDSEFEKLPPGAKFEIKYLPRD